MVINEFLDIFEDFSVPFSDDRFAVPRILCCGGKLANKDEWDYEECFDPLDEFISTVRF